MRYPIYLNYSVRIDDLVGFVELDDERLSEEHLASVAIVPAVKVASKDGPVIEIMGWGMVHRRNVDTRVHPELGES